MVVFGSTPHEYTFDKVSLFDGERSIHSEIDADGSIKYFRVNTSNVSIDIPDKVLSQIIKPLFSTITLMSVPYEDENGELLYYADEVSLDFIGINSCLDEDGAVYYPMNKFIVAFFGATHTHRFEKGQCNA